MPLRDERETLIADRQQLVADLPIVEAALREATTRAATIADRVRVGVADAADLKPFHRGAHDAGVTLGRVTDRLDAIAKRLPAIDADIQAREAAAESARVARLAKEERRATIAAARAVVEAMRLVTYARRVGQVSGSGLASLASLNSDAPQSGGREWLQLLMDRGLLTVAELEPR
jgi:hypothetical protein